MRTFVALVLLAAVASNGFTMKYGPLKGSWFSEIYIDGYSLDSDAPTMSDFEIEGSSEDYVFDADDYTTVEVTYSVVDGDDDSTCTLDFEMFDDDDEVIAAWSTSSIGTGSQTVTVPVNANGMEGDYYPRLECMDTEGNMRWWGVEEGLPMITFTNANADTVGYDLSAYTISDNSDIEVDDEYIEYDPFDAIEVTIDYTESTGGDPLQRSARGDAELWVSFTADDPSIASWEDFYAGVCSANPLAGTCTFTIGVSASQWEFGNYEITGIYVWDTAGNMGSKTSGLDDIEFSLGNAPDEVLSCQSIDFDEDSYTYYDSIDTTTDTGYLYLVANCNSQSILESDYNMVSVQYGMWATLSVYEDNVETLVGASYGSDYLDYDTSKAYLAVEFTEDGCPRGTYALQSVTTTTQWGGIQYYTIEEGSAATVSAMFGIVLAVVVALF